MISELDESPVRFESVHGMGLPLSSQRTPLLGSEPEERKTKQNQAKLKKPKKRAKSPPRRKRRRKSLKAKSPLDLTEFNENCRPPNHPYWYMVEDYDT